MINLLCLSLTIISAVTWQNTGELNNALNVYDIVVGPGNNLFASTKIASSNQDSGCVFYSQDMWSWQAGNDIPGALSGVYSMINGTGDTLFIGTGVYYASVDSPRVFKSSDAGLSWQVLNSYGSYRPGTKVTALLEDYAGNLQLGNNYWGMSSAIPRYSTDRGTTWQLGGGTINYNSEHYCFLQASDSTLYFGSWGTGGGVHYSTDYGVTWNPASALSGVSDSYTLIEAGRDTVLVGTDADIGRIYRTTDKGTTWVELGAGYFAGTTSIRALLETSDGAIYAGTSPNAEVFVSVDRGATWVSTGTLSGATTVYKLIEAHKITDVIDSCFIFAATGPNGDVFRGLLSTVNVDEEKLHKFFRKRLAIFPNPAPSTVRFVLCGIEEFNPEADLQLKVYTVDGRLVKTFRHLTPTIKYHLVDDTGKKLSPGVYCVTLESAKQIIDKKKFTVIK